MPVGLINWGNAGQPAATDDSGGGFSSGRINWGGIFANDRAAQKTSMLAKANEQNQLKIQMQKTQAQQQSKGINNPQSLVQLQSQLKLGQINQDQFNQQFSQASKGAKGAAVVTPFKLTPGTIASSAGQATNQLAKGAVQSEQTAATGIARILPGGLSDIQAQTQGANQAAKNIQFVKQQQRAGKITPQAASKIISTNAQTAGQSASDVSKTVKAMPTKGQLAAGFGGTAADILTAGTLPEAKGTGILPKVARGTTAPAALGTASALNTASGGGTKKQIVGNAIAGAAFPLGLKALGKGAEALRGRAVATADKILPTPPADNVIKAAKETSTKSEQAPSPSPAVSETKTAPVPVKVETGDTPSIEQGGEVTPSKSTKSPLSTAEQVTTKQKMNETGSVAPGQAITDIQQMIDKHNQVTKGSSDIAKGLDINTGMQKDIKLDAASVLNNRTKLTPEEHQQIQDYRDAKATGQTPQELPSHLQVENDHITQLNKAAQKADAETARLSGNLQKAKTIEARDPETYTHLIAQNKGGSIDKLLQGTRDNPLSVGGLSKTTSGSKKQVLFSATDETGNRRTVSIKSQSFKAPNGQKVTKTNQIIAYTNGGKTKELLGSIPSKVNIEGKTFVGKDGQKYTIGQAMQREKTANAGQKYYVDPKLTSVINYADSRTALENTRFIENTKKALENKNLAVKIGEPAPKGFKPSSNLYFHGYSFHPKVREVLEDAAYKSKDGLDLLNRIGHVARQTIVYLPIKHDLNEAAFYAIDRGLTNFVNPFAVGRMGVALGKATRDVIKQEGVYKQMLRSGSHLMTADDKQFGKVVSKQLKAVTKDDPRLKTYAKNIGTSPVKLYNAIQKVSVWGIQDILNVARVRENMMRGVLKKGMSFDDALKQSEKFGLQYRVPSRAGIPGKAGRSFSNTLRSPKVFFGPYTYDKYRVTKNIVKDVVNVRHPIQAGRAVDKAAAMAFGAAILWPIVEKGVKSITGDPNAHVTAPGPLAIPQTIEKVAKGQQSPETAAKNQISLGTPLTAGMDILNNRDSFTGKLIRDPNAPQPAQGKQLLSYLTGQLAPAQKFKGGKNASQNKVLSTGLSLAGASLPKNSPEATKLYSLQYDSLPMVQAQAKQLAKDGNLKAAQTAIDQYNTEVRKAAQADAKASNRGMPNDKSLKKAGILYQPKQSTVSNWAKGKKPKAGAFTP